MSKEAPKLSRRPPTSSISTIDKLKAIDKWSEAPAVAAAAAIAAPVMTPIEVDNDAKKTPEVAPEAVSKSKPKEKGKGAERPWSNASEEVLANFMLRLNQKSRAKLKFLAETTYGETMHSIAIDAVEARIEQMLKERGLNEKD